MGLEKQAQGAALCHYLLFGDNGAHRIRFLGVIRKFLEGDASEDDLPKALGKPIEEIEKDLEAYMKGRIGS